MINSPRPNGRCDTLDDLLQKDLARALGMPVLRDLPRAGTCPDPGTWIDLATEVPLKELADQLLNHAALCSSCLRRLRESRELFSNEASATETEDLARFAAANTEWHRRLAAELARTSHRLSSRRLIWFIWSGAGLAAEFALVFAFFLSARHHSPERLLAETYSRERIFDLRIPGAAFAPVTPRLHLRGMTENREPADLVAARAEIERNLKRSPADTHWLQLEARAALLGERYDDAVRALDRLVAEGPATPSLLLDDGTAHFVRGAVFDNEDDRAAGLNVMRRADQVSPRDPVVLFNEAVAMEDRGQLSDAVQTWKRCLETERDPQWLEEERHRLQSLLEKWNR